MQLCLWFIIWIIVVMIEIIMVTIATADDSLISSGPSTAMKATLTSTYNTIIDSFTTIMAQGMVLQNIVRVYYQYIGLCFMSWSVRLLTIDGIYLYLMLLVLSTTLIYGRIDIIHGLVMDYIMAGCDLLLPRKYHVRGLILGLRQPMRDGVTL